MSCIEQLLTLLDKLQINILKEEHQQVVWPGSKEYTMPLQVPLPFTIVKLLFYVAKCFGLLPYDIHGTVENVEFKGSVVSYVYFAAVWAFVAYIKFLSFFNIKLFTNMPDDEDDICTLITELLTLAMNICHILLSSVYLLRRANYARNIRELFSVEENFEKPVSVARYSRILMFHMSICICFIIWFVATELFFAPRWNHVASLVVELGTELCIIIHFMGQALLVRHYFLQINKTIEDLPGPHAAKWNIFSLLEPLKSEKLDGDGKIHNVLPFIDEIPVGKKPFTSEFINPKHPVKVQQQEELSVRNLSEKTRHFDLNFSKVNVAPKATSGEDQRKRLIAIARLHDRVSQLAQDVNAFFSLPNLIVVTDAFLAIAGCSYSFLYKLLIKDNKEEAPLKDLVDNIAWVLVNVYLLVALTWASNSTASQANRTPVLVHKAIRLTKDEEIKEELKLFSMQLLHRKVQFTACGFFPLDYTLLYSVTGAVTTYLVILLQFQMAMKS